VTRGLHVPFYFEHELRARHPRGILARLRSYGSYYWSPEHEENQPPLPTTLFVVGTEEVEDTYVHLRSLEPIARATQGFPATARRWYLFQCTVVGAALS